MKFSNILLVVIILIGVAPQAILPACSWYWPIMGFMPPDGGCPNICGGPSLPSPYDAMTPGTLQWGYPPVDRATLVYPGCAYGADAFRNHLSFGSSLPFGDRASGFGPVSASNNTSAKGAPANKTVANATEAGGLLGWLSSRP